MSAAKNGNLKKPAEKNNRIPPLSPIKNRSVEEIKNDKKEIKDKRKNEILDKQQD